MVTGLVTRWVSGDVVVICVATQVPSPDGAASAWWETRCLAILLLLLLQKQKQQQKQQQQQ